MTKTATSSTPTIIRKTKKKTQGEFKKKKNNTASTSRTGFFVLVKSTNGVMGSGHTQFLVHIGSGKKRECELIRILGVHVILYIVTARGQKKKKNKNSLD